MSEAKQGQREGERLALPLWPRAGSCPFSTGPAAALLCPHPPPPPPPALVELGQVIPQDTCLSHSTPSPHSAPSVSDTCPQGQV